MPARRHAVIAKGKSRPAPEGDTLTPGRRLALALAILARGQERREAARQESEQAERKRAA